MATPLKDSFGSDVPRRIAEAIAVVRSDFPVGRFLVDALNGYEDLELLELLKDDESLYVRRSVANNLNDIGKDHPGLLIATCRRWMEEASPERRWLIRHSLRSAVKRGDRAALEVLGFGATGSAEVEDMTIVPRRPAIGERIRIRFTLRNSTRDSAAFNVDLRVHFVRANGGTSPRCLECASSHSYPVSVTTCRSSFLFDSRQQGHTIWAGMTWRWS